MSISRNNQLSWAYNDSDPEESFNKRIGTILNRGQPMTILPESAPVRARRGSQNRNPDITSKFTPPKQHEPVVVPRDETGLPDVTMQGHNWVDETGNTLSSTQHLGTKTRSPGIHVLNRPQTSTPSTRRSQNLWKRTSPGIMEQFIYTPISTTHDHFQLDETLADPKLQVSWDLHRRKTDFTQYVEADAKLKHLVKGKGMPA